MKKIAVAILITIVAIVSVYILLKILNKPVIYKGISTRAQDYINQQKLKNNQSWDTLRIATQESKPKQEAVVDTNDCFSITIPYQVMRIKEEESCNKYITFNSPRGEITVYQVKAETTI